MPATTTRGAFPYPLGGDPPDTDGDLKKLADAVAATAALDSQGTAAARPAAGVVGRYYYATDTGFLFRDTGTAWVQVAVLGAAQTFTTAQRVERTNTTGATGGFVTRVTGDTQDRARLDVTGELWLGPGGTTPADTRVYRDAAGLRVSRPLIGDDGVTGRKEAGGAAVTVTNRDDNTSSYLRRFGTALEVINNAYTASVLAVGDNGTLTLPSGTAALVAQGMRHTQAANDATVSTTSTGYVDLGGPEVQFVAPPSGVVTAFLHAYINGAGGHYSAETFDVTGNALVAGATDPAAVVAVSGAVAASSQYLVSGLIAGRTYRLRPRYRSSTGASVSFLYRRALVIPSP